MSCSAHELEPRATAVQIENDELVVLLADGRRIAVPLTWFPRLLAADQNQRANFEFLGDGVGIHWPELDEDLGVAGLLRGMPAPGGRR